MNENARQQRNQSQGKRLAGRLYQTLGAGTKAARGSKTAERCDRPKMNRGALGGDSPLKLRRSLPLSEPHPSTSHTTPWWEAKPPKADPVRGSEGTQTLPRGASRGQGGAPCQGSVPATTTIPSRDGADPHSLPWAAHTGEEGQQTQQRGPTDPHAPQSPPQGGGTEPLTSSRHTWLEGGRSHRPSPCRGVCDGTPPAEGHPRPSHPSEKGDGHPTQLRGPPDLHTAQCGGTDSLTASHG